MVGAFVGGAAAPAWGGSGWKCLRCEPRTRDSSGLRAGHEPSPPGFPILGAERRAEASHLEAPLTGRHGRPARPGSRQYSPQGRWRSATGARARWEPPSAAPPPAPRGPPGQLPHPWTSSASLPSPAEPLPWPSPSASEPLRAERPARSRRLTCAERLQAVSPRPLCAPSAAAAPQVRAPLPARPPPRRQPALPQPRPPLPAPARGLGRPVSKSALPSTPLTLPPGCSLAPDTP